MTRPYRSVLYIPASRARAMEKAKTLSTDAIIFDLEDAVAVDEKANARSLLAQTLTEGGFGTRAQIIRINGFDTDWGADDLATIADAKPQAVLLPKVNSAADIETLAARLDATPGTADTHIWAMMETPQGILNAASIAAAPRMAGFVMGTNDLAKDLGARTRDAMVTSLQLCLLAARAHGLVCVDGVYNAFRDDDGLARECAQGRDFGFDGKTLIHPAQLATANAIFAPKGSRSWTARSSRICMSKPRGPPWPRPMPSPPARPRDGLAPPDRGSGAMVRRACLETRGPGLACGVR